MFGEGGGRGAYESVALLPRRRRNHRNESLAGGRCGGQHLRAELCHIDLRVQRWLEGRTKQLKVWHTPAVAYWPLQWGAERLGLYS